jgi:hypothetical protein
MLTGLSKGDESAQHCFLLLQNNSHFYESYTSKISWNHIFYAFERYHDSFRLDQSQQLFYQQQQQMMYQQQRQLSSNKGITQQELQGLIAVVKLVNQIAVCSEKARLALCEYQRGGGGGGGVNPGGFLLGSNSSTDVISMFGGSGGMGGVVNGTSVDSNNNLLGTMFGLVTCPIAISLKGEILNLLASFALSQPVAINIWQLLESSQLLPTMQPHQQQQQQYFKNNIRIELEEVEARDETYPLLRGFLTLVRNLIRATYLPENLGIGIRQKGSILGFQPYLQFLVDQCYLKGMFFVLYLHVENFFFYK